MVSMHYDCLILETCKHGSAVLSSQASKRATAFERWALYERFYPQLHYNMSALNSITNFKPLRSKKSLSVESPPFTPSQLPSSSTVITSRIASAPTFTPRGLSSGTATPSAQSEDNVFNPSQIREFTPQLYDTTAINGASNDGSHFDPFGTPQAAPAQQYNPYLEDPNALTASNAAFYGAQTAFTATTQPVSISERSI